MTRPLALVADDFGAGAAIDHGVLELVRAGRLSGVSCLVGGSTWAQDAGALMAERLVQRGCVRAGLHLNLTEGAPLSPALAARWPRLPGLAALIVRAHAGALPRDALQGEIAAQFVAFERHAGAPPAHVDGHQHVHHLPLVRELLLAEAARRPGLRVRSTARVAGPGHAFKRFVIQRTGGRALARALPAGRAANTVLLGTYDFATRDYRALMQRWLQAVPASGGLVYCHPAHGEPAAGDAIAAARQREFDYLASDAFADDLAHADVRLAPAGK